MQFWLLVSAVAKAAALEANLPLYRYVGGTNEKIHCPCQ